MDELIRRGGNRNSSLISLFISSMFIMFRTEIFGAASLLDVFVDGFLQLSTFYATVES